eukprot:606383-Amphidinium_carterae.1
MSRKLHRCGESSCRLPHVWPKTTDLRISLSSLHGRNRIRPLQADLVSLAVNAHLDNSEHEVDATMPLLC